LDQAGWFSPSESGLKTVAGGSIHQFLWRCSRIVSTREKGTVRSGAMRNRSEPSQVVRAGFGSGRIAVTQRVFGCYCASARPGGSGGLNARPAKRKSPKGGTKWALALGRTQGFGTTRENLPKSRR